MSKFTSKEMEVYRQHVGKVIIPEVAKAIDNELHEKQEELSKWFMGKKRKEWWYLSLLAARRFGKTRGLTVIATSELLTPFSNVGIIAPSMSISKEFFNFISRYLKNLKEQGHIKDFRASISELHIHIPETGSNLYIASQTTFEDRLVGKAFSMLIFDESFLMEDRFVTEAINVLVPAGANYGTYENGMPIMKVVSISTPRNRPTATTVGRNHLKGLYENDEGYKSLKYTIYDSPFIDEKGIDALRKQMNEDRFKREFLCEFAVDSTGVFPRFSQERNVIDINFEDIKRRAQDHFLVTAADWGAKDASAFTMGVYDSKLDKAYILKDFFKGNFLNEDFINLMKDEEKKLMESLNIPQANILRFADPSGLQSRMQAASMDYPMQRAINSRNEGYDTVNDWFEGTYDKTIDEKVPDLYIDRSCSKLIQQVMAAEYKESQGVKTNVLKRDTEHLHYDLAETLRYWVASMKRFTKKTDPIVV